MLTSIPLTNNTVRRVIASIAAFLALIFLVSCTSTGVKTTPIDTSPTSTTTATVEITESDREKFNAGLGAMNNNDFGTAERIFSDLIDDQPELAGPYCNMALIHLKKKDYQKSLEIITHAITLNKTIAQAYNIRAQTLVATGKIQDAEKDYIQAISLDENYANAHYNLALLYDIYYQEINKAIKHYEIYLSLLDQPDKSTKEWVNHLKGSLKHG